MSHKDLVLSWLNDAYAMEQHFVKVFENRVKDTKNHPQLHAKVQEHLEETRRHAELVKGEIERMGGKPSTTKSWMSQAMGMAENAATGMAKDEMIKNALSGYAGEHQEIASYRSLIVAAEEIGDTQLAETCRTILRDEENMAKFIGEHIPMITREELHKAMQSHAGQTTSQDMAANP